MPNGELYAGEPHPAAFEAKAWLEQIPITRLHMYLESYSSCAIDGNRLADVCAETLSRLMDGKPVSDRYVLGLAWSLKSMEEGEDVP